MSIKVIVAKNYEDLSSRANEIMRELLLSKPNATLGLATGSSPLGLYKCMIADCENGVTSYENIDTYNLDEYVGLTGDHPQSYRYFMNANLFDHINIDKDDTHVPCGKVADPEAECRDYTSLLENNPRDVQVLGLGSNGHIAFNEPGTPFTSHTHIVKLQERTITDNARFFDSIDEVPTTAITMGLADIMAARKILLVANGKNKAEAVYAMIKGEITVDCPASILQNHPDVTVVADEAAASLL